MIEALLDEPYLVIDFLPEQVPVNAAGQYFAIEKHLRQPRMLADLHRRFTAILLKLNCFYDLQAGPPDGSLVSNPPPERLESWICAEEKDLCVLLPGENALVTLNHDDLYMTVYHPSEALAALLEQLASAEGLFLRRPEQDPQT